MDPRAKSTSRCRRALSSSRIEGCASDGELMLFKGAVLPPNVAAMPQKRDLMRGSKASPADQNLYHERALSASGMGNDVTRFAINICAPEQASMRLGASLRDKGRAFANHTTSSAFA